MITWRGTFVFFLYENESERERQREGEGLCSLRLCVVGSTSDSNLAFSG